MRTAWIKYFVFGIKYLVLVLLIFVFLIGSTRSVSAQNTTQQSQYLTPNTNSDVPNNLHTWTQNVMLEVMSAMGCQLTGIDITTKDHRCLGTDLKTGKIGYLEIGSGGILGFVSNSIVTLYTPPAGSGDYVRYLAGNFGIAKSALAQATPGYGVTSLSPLTNLWVVFRNFVYLMYVLVFIIIGLAIMFRVKIDPRTVMSIQNQIPKIIVSLILVTFSFAIAGFLIDLMYAVSYLMVGLIIHADTNLQIHIQAETINHLISSSSPFNAINTIGDTNVFHNGIQSIADGAAGAVGTHLGDLFGGTVGGTIGTLIGGVIGAVLFGNVSIAGFSVGGLGGAMIGGVIGFFGGSTIMGGLLTIVTFLIIVITIIAALFRLWFQLIMAYINILIDVIFAPVWILAGLVPGSKINFSAWLRDLIANLSAFPVVLAMFALARVFIDAFGNTTEKNSFIPPLIGNPANNQQIGALIALGFILITPSVVKMLKSMLKAPGTGFGPIMETLTGGLGVTKALGTPVWRSLYHVRRDKDGNESREGLVGARVGKYIRDFNEQGPIANVKKIGTGIRDKIRPRRTP